MRKWYLWLLLAGVFAIGGLLNYWEGRSITAAIIQVIVTVLMAVVQYFCDKKGEKGKKVFQYISASVMVLLVIWLLALILS